MRWWRDGRGDCGKGFLFFFSSSSFVIARFVLVEDMGCLICSLVRPGVRGVSPSARAHVCVSLLGYAWVVCADLLVAVMCSCSFILTYGACLFLSTW